MIPEGFRTALNQIRETSIESDTLYAKYVDQILPDSDITSWASPILTNPQIMNEFFNVLVQRIIYTQIDVKLFNNPLAILDGDTMPLGSIGQEIAVNPIKGRKFNVDDFAGLLARYEADIKVQYMHLNSDIQYPVTITRAKIVDAFTSWEKLGTFVDSITNALYNGAYIDRFNMTKGLVSSAYEGNNVQIKTVTAVSSEATAKAFVKEARNLYKLFRFPSTKYNAWAKVGGYGRELLTWCNPEDIVFLIRADVSTELDVDVLANAFNIDKTSLMGRIIDVDNFDVYDGDVKVIDGSNIVGIMADKRWFRIKTREMTMDEFYNANNRTWQFYLNDVRMYQYSLFANAVVFATEMPVVEATDVDFVNKATFEINEGKKRREKVTLSPINATTETTFTSSDPNVIKVTKISDTEVELEGMSADTNLVTITATNNGHTDTIQGKCVTE